MINIDQNLGQTSTETVRDMSPEAPLIKASNSPTHSLTQTSQNRAISDLARAVASAIGLSGIDKLRGWLSAAWGAK